MIINTIADLRKVRKTISDDQSVGFVPTMGNLHAGHLALAQAALAQTDVTIVSIFVNPTQFNQTDDFNQYPNTMSADIAALQTIGVDYIWLPSVDEIYADDYRYKITEMDVSQALEGAHRPGHFDGVLTVLMKLFALVRPNRAFFGEKDYQQLLLVQGLVKAFFLDIEVIACPTARDPQGLALSSRNSRLTAEQRVFSSLLSLTLRSCISSDAATAELQKKGFNVEYVADCWGRRLAAVVVDGVRLIDNIELEGSV